MKKILSAVATLLLTGSMAWSQSMDDVKKSLYYEHTATAKNMLQSMTTSGEASPEAYYRLAEIFLSNGQVDSAEQTLQAANAKFAEQNLSRKKEPWLFIGDAHLQLAKGNVAEAKQAFTEVLNAGKFKNAEALLEIAKANINSNKGDSAWAIELLMKAAERDKKNPAIYTALGDAYRKMVDGSNAVRNYDKALELNPEYAEALYKKGKLYKTQNNPEIYVKLFNNAVAADSTYSPALYELYYYNYFRDVTKAADYLKAYIRHSDPSPEHAYMLADLHYVSKKYDTAIQEATQILQREGANAPARLYKLVAYSEAALGDSAKALESLNTYFEKQNDTGFVAKDYAMKAALLQRSGTDTTAIIDLYTKALAKETIGEDSVDYMTSLADIENKLGNREAEANWREKIYNTKKSPSNLDIYKWGTAVYSAGNYPKADSVFAVYEEKYPDQVHGYLWRARSNALIDTTMALGLAVPHYKKLVEVATKDSVLNKPLLVTAYEYLGAYEANTTKDFSAALGYFNKILELDADNSNAKQNVALLTKWIDQGKGVSSSN